MANKIFDYPLEQDVSWGLRAWERFLIGFSNRKILRRKRRTGNSIVLNLSRQEQFRPLSSADLPLVVCTRNDRRMLPSFLAHYRKLGVTRFIFVDDQSTDDTLEYLLAHPDVDVWLSPSRYAEARRGRLWREALISKYGFDRWYLNVDTDEYLVYPEHEKRPLKDLIETLEQRGQKRLVAPMLDLYPVGDLSASEFIGDDGQMPWDVADHFDSSGYKLEIKQRYLSLTGGPRRRLFGSELEMMKYPLLYWDDSVTLGASVHQPTPFERNFYPIEGVLLHFKFFADYQAKIAEAVDGGQYYDGSKEYKRIMEVTKSVDDLDFGSPVSDRYESPEQLHRLGLISSPFRE
jgi:glycosyltransferase involved in cell wall biosynthesis